MRRHRTVRTALVLAAALSTTTCASPRELAGVTPPSRRGGLPGGFFALSVADVDRVARWYHDTLGFEVMRQGEAPNGIARFALLRRGAAMVEIIQHRDGRPRAVVAPGTTAAHQVHGFFKAGFIVDDIDALHRAVTARGVPLAYGLGRAGDTDYRSFGVRDPEGNLLQFFGP